MKKLLTMTAAFLAAMSLNAQVENLEMPYNAEGGFYEIWSVQDLVALAKNVNDKDSYEIWKDRSFKVMVSELDFINEEKFIPIGRNSERSFSGVFDGNGVIIKNIYVKDLTPTANGVGLFGYIHNAIIKNIVMDESCTVEGNNTIGAFVGKSYGSTIMNCINKANVYANSFAGGIVGSADPIKEKGKILVRNNISDCSNKGTLNFSSPNDTQFGGIVGMNGEECSVNNCENHGNFIVDPKNKGSYYGEYLGGIVGYNKGLIKNCVNTSDISSPGQNLGGIAGFSGGDVSGCHNSGKVSAGLYYVGGIVGSIQYSTVSDCVNIADVSSNSSQVGGVIGSVYRCKVNNCIAKGCKVSGTYKVGALFGEYDTPYSAVWDNYYYDDVEVTVDVLTYTGETLRGVGDVKNKEPKDIKFVTVENVLYYNGAVLMLPDEKLPIQMGNGGKMTYCASWNLDFSSLTDVKAYIATGYDLVTSEIWLTRVMEVPAGTPIWISGPKDELIKIPIGKSITYYPQSLLVGSATESITVLASDDENLNMTLSPKSGKTAVVSTDIKDFAAYKAYLHLPKGVTSIVGPDAEVTLNSHGKLAYVCKSDLDFTNVDGLKAYIVTGYAKDGTIWMTRVMKASAGTPLYLKGEKNVKYTIPSVETKLALVNMLKGDANNPTALSAVDGEFTSCVLSKGTGEFGPIGKDNDAFPAGTAYLPLPTAYMGGSAKSRARGNGEYVFLESEAEVICVKLFGDGETTGINKVAGEDMDSEKWYNLNGQRIDAPVRKGLYIKNGKKVIVK